MIETRDQLLNRIGRIQSSLYGYRRAYEKYYNRTRKLESAIKKHARNECDCKSHGECLTRLVALTPVNPRPTLKERLKR